MEREEALRLLRGGPEGIAEWNCKTPGERPDLGSADLRRADLRRADLSGTNLRGANFVGADLRGADLRRAYLHEADLHEADLREANLVVATCSAVDFRSADLRGADLRATLLRVAKLESANFSMALCNGTSFSGLDLSTVQGLEEVQHLGPSTIGVDTLYQSQGKIPEAFLRGCGVPESLITYLPSLIGSMQPIQFYSCFISYSSKDHDFATRFHSRMRDENLRVWFAPEDMKGGLTSREQIEGAIHVYDKLLLVLSKASMASNWVQHEIRTAIKREELEKTRVLFPIRVCSWKLVKEWECFDSDSGRDLASYVRRYHIPDFSKWKDHDSFEKAFAQLLRDLKKAAVA